MRRRDRRPRPCSPGYGSPSSRRWRLVATHRQCSFRRFELPWQPRPVAGTRPFSLSFTHPISFDEGLYAGSLIFLSASDLGSDLAHRYPAPLATALRRRRGHPHGLQRVIDPGGRRAAGMQRVDERLQLRPIGVAESFHELVMPLRHLTPAVIKNRRVFFVDLGNHFALAAVDLGTDV